MTSKAPAPNSGDLGARLAAVADMLDQAVAALNEAVRDVRAREQGAAVDRMTKSSGNRTGGTAT